MPIISTGQRDIQMVLERWGAWAASDSSGVDYSPIAAGFKGLLPCTSKARQACSDDDALIIESCLARLKQKKPYEHSLLVAHYLYRVPKRKIAKVHKKDEKLIRIEIQLAEGFIDGCLSMLDVTLEMDG
ncbi:antiterminator Q family protein [Hafnia alvei]|uniref:antiterminator Q family protein n=1 Tax=Hafnia alvei TaxID=569 RepID=UPI001411C00A|nr:antiterminator Q family protein [Hafnia alvei]QIP56849.1 antitermination protein Q [Hafnia alvei]